MENSSRSMVRYVVASQEDRCAPRTRVSVPATLRTTEGRTFHTRLRDVSVAGFAALALEPLAPGRTVWLSIPGIKEREAQVVWWNAGLAGCAFVNLLEEGLHEALVARWQTRTTFLPAA